MNPKTYALAAVAVAVVALLVAFGGHGGTLAGDVYNKIVNFSQGIDIGSNHLVDSSGNVTVPGTLAVTGASTFTGNPKGNFIVSGTVLAKTASTGWTLTAAQVCADSLVTFNNSGAGASTSYVRFPTATALAADCLSTAGDSKTFVIRNLSNDAGEVGTLTTNTGLTLKKASGSAATLDVNEGAVVRVINRTGSAFDVIYSEFGN